VSQIFLKYTFSWKRERGNRKQETQLELKTLYLVVSVCPSVCPPVPIFRPRFILVDDDQSGSIPGALIGQNTEAMLAPGSTAQVYRDRCTVFLYCRIIVPSIVCASFLVENAVAGSILLESKNVRKEGANICQL
jgi:hypothetical protein